jgi:hypothetical protein
MLLRRRSAGTRSALRAAAGGTLMTTNTRKTIELDERDIIPMEELRWNVASGKIGWALLWLLGVPLPVLLVIWLLRGH